MFAQRAGRAAGLASRVQSVCSLLVSVPTLLQFSAYRERKKFFDLVVIHFL